MISRDLIEIRNKLLYQISLTIRSIFPIESLEKESVVLSFIKDFLHAQITACEITVFYANEHDEFWKETYNNEEAWIKDASKLIVMLATNVVYIDNYYNKRTSELLYYKIWVKQKEKKRLVKKVVVSNKLFSAFKEKEKVTKVLSVPKQGNDDNQGTVL